MAIMLRLKCPSCGEVMNAAGFCNCTKCGTPIRYNGWGMLQIYRMGSPVGIAAGYGIYLDGQPYGHLANKESIRIPLPMGTHTLHMTCGMTRRCEDLTFTLTPEAPGRLCQGVHPHGLLVEHDPPDSGRSVRNAAGVNRFFQEKKQK